MSGVQWGLVLPPVLSLFMGIVIGWAVGWAVVWAVDADDERKRLAPWKDAVLDALANTSMDAPMDEPPASILARVIAWHVMAATDPTIAAPGDVEQHPLLLRAYEVVHHERECPSIGGRGDDDCRCDAVPFLRDLAAALRSQGQADAEFPLYEFTTLLMCCDPWPVADNGHGTGEDAIEALADAEARKAGFDGWIDAYHQLKAPRAKP